MRGSAGVAFVVLLSLVTPDRPAGGQSITIDGRLSPARTLAGPNYAITPDLGKQVGGNLFHSFGIFGLATGETATFSGPAGVTNIIGRVTGGTASAIDGTIRSTVPGASLFLINPAGVIFGPNATTDVSGGFHASTADYVRMSDGARYQATNPQASTLTAAAPAAFGFTSVTPAAISVNGGTLGPATGTLGLVAGSITAKAATLRAPGGTIHIAAVAGPSEVPTDPAAGRPVALGPTGQPTANPVPLGPVTISSGSVVDVTAGTGAGNVVLRGSTLAIDGSSIQASTADAFGGGQVILQGGTRVSLTGGTSVKSIAGGAGSGATVTIATDPNGTVVLDNASITVGTTSTGAGGGVSINTGTLVMQNIAVIGSTGLAPGPAGDIGIVASDIHITTGSALLTATQGSGRGGSVSLNVAGSLTIDGSSSTGLFTGISADSNAGASGQAGNVTALAGDVLLANGGAILSDTHGAGPGGSIALTAIGNLTIDGTATPTRFTGIGASTLGTPGGPAGDVTLAASNLRIAGTGAIFANTLGNGAGGSITLAIPGQITIDGTATRAYFTGIAAVTLGAPGGPAGNVNITAGSATLTGGVIAANTQGTGTGGAVSMTIREALVLDGSATLEDFTGISTDTFAAAGGGHAGQSNIAAGSILVRSSGAISSSTKGSGAAGNVLVVSAGDLTIDATGSTLVTGIASQTYPGSTGNAGSIAVRAASMTITGGGVVSATSTGSGSGGNVAVAVERTLALDAGGRITSASENFGAAGSVSAAAGRLLVFNGAAITTEAHSANGGSIVLSIADTLFLSHGAITTSVNGADGNSGNITIDPRYVVLQDSTIWAKAFAGRGGNIEIAAGELLLSPASTILATSAHNVSGVVDVRGPEPNVSGSIAVLASTLRAAAVVLTDSCATRGRNMPSHLVAAGRGSTHQELEATLPALYIAGRSPLDHVATVPATGILPATLTVAMRCD